MSESPLEDIDDMIVLAPSRKKALVVYDLLKKKSDDLKLSLHPLTKGSKTQLIDLTKNDLVFLGIGISRKDLYIPQKAIEGFKKTFEREIVNSRTVKQFPFNNIIQVYNLFAEGWVNYYKSICPRSYLDVERDLNNYLKKYIEKHKTRKTVASFFGKHRLVLNKPFLK